MPDVLIVPSANSGTDLTGALRSNGAEPLTVSGLVNGTEYVAYALSDPSGAFTPEAVVSEWTITAGDGDALISSSPATPPAPTATAGDGEAILETA